MRHCLGQLRPVIPLAAFGLHVSADKFVAAKALQVIGYRCFLGLYPKPRLTLFAGTYPKIQNKAILVDHYLVLEM